MWGNHQRPVTLTNSDPHDLKGPTVCLTLGFIARRQNLNSGHSLTSGHNWANPTGQSGHTANRARPEINPTVQPRTTANRASHPSHPWGGTEEKPRRTPQVIPQGYPPGATPQGGPPRGSPRDSPWGIPLGFPLGYPPSHSPRLLTGDAMRRIFSNTSKLTNPSGAANWHNRSAPLPLTNSARGAMWCNGRNRSSS